MKTKILLLLILTSLCVSICAKEIATINSNAEKFKTFNGLKLENCKVGRVNDKSYVVYHSKDKFGVGVTKGGEFTISYNDKRLTLAGLSGMIAYDVNNPDKLYRLDISKFNKEGYISNCKELGLEMTTKIISRDTSVEFENNLTCNSDKKIVLAFCLPMDGTTTLLKDSMVWIKDFSTAYDTGAIEDEDSFTYEAPNDKSISRYPIGAMLTGYMSIAMSTSPLSRDSKFIFYKSLKSFANQYELNLKKDQPVDIDFSVYRIPYEWGFRGAYEKYTEFYPNVFPKKELINAKDIKELDGTDYYFKSLLTFEGYKIKGPIDIKDLYFIKCAAKNKPVYYEIPDENFEQEYAKAIFLGFIPQTDNTSNPVIKKYRETFMTIQNSTWSVIPQSESKNEAISTERYIQKNVERELGKDEEKETISTYIVAYNDTDMKRVTFVILYDFNVGNKVINVVDHSEYNVKNKAVDIIINPYDLALFKF